MSVESAQDAVNAAELALVNAGCKDPTLLLIAIAMLGRANAALVREETSAALRMHICRCDKCQA